MIKNKRKVIKHTIWAAALCLVMGMGIVSFADDKGTVIPASAKIRASADASSEQVGSVAQGGSVDIIGKTTGTDGNTWYQVYVDANTKGYIRADLVKAAGTGTISTITSETATTTTTTTASTTDQSVTEATAVDAKKCTVSQNSARIRKGASTNHDVVATANRGMTLTVTGEANGSDGKLWYQVTFTYNNKEITGFIRSDLVTFDEVSSDAAVSEIQGEAGEESNVEQETEETTQTQEEETSDNSSQGIVLMNVDETPYILPGFSAVSLSWNDESIKAYSNGGFYLFYAKMANGDEGWYVFDSEKGEYQRYVYTASSTATIPKSSDSIGIVPVIVLIVIIIILVAIIGFLAVKLRDASYSDEYDDDYQDDEDDVEDLEFEEIQPRRQPSQNQYRQTQQPQGQRRPVQQSQGQVGQNTQGQRRPVQQSQGQVGQNAQGQRRPVQQSQGQASQNAQGQRRPVQQSQGQANPNAQGQRRPVQQSQGQANPNAQAQRRPQQRPTSNNESAQGYKAKTILENENEDDMDFIDV